MSEGSTEEPAVEDIADTDDEALPFRYSITSYGADYPVDSLVRRLERDDVFVPPFQRRYVWTWPQASRFIESLLLGLPVPGVFLAKEADTQRLQIIDGQQRLLTLLYFASGLFGDTGREFTLRGVQERFVGKSYRTLEEDDRRRLDDSIIHATIVKQDEPTDDSSSVYLIFERLNTGGTPLSPQEIRASVSHGSFIDLLKRLNEYPRWRGIFGNASARLKDEELILRFLALFEAADRYARPMKVFLNDFIAGHRNPSRDVQERWATIFLQVVDLISAAIGGKAFRPHAALNAAVFDAVMVGLARRLARGPVSDVGQLRRAYDALVTDPEFAAAYTRSTADETQVAARLAIASEAFERVP